MTTYEASTADGSGTGGNDLVDPAAIVPGMADDTAAAGPDASAPQAPVASKRRRWLIVGLSIVTLLVLLLALLSIWALHTRKPLTTLPGIGKDVPHYAFSIYGMTQPLGVAVTKSGNRIYVTESGGTREVKVYDRSGKPVGALKPPKSTGAAHVPVYVAISPVNGDVYVSDRVAAEVYVYDSDGKFLRTFQPKGDIGPGWAPLGLAFDGKGRLYVTDVRADPHRVLVFDEDDTLERAIGVDDGLSFPNGVTVDAHGRIEVSDSNNGRVLVFDADGEQLAAITRGVGRGDLGLPRGATVDSNGLLYVVDTFNHAVRIYRVGTAKSPLPTYIDSFGDEGTLDGLFEYPNGIATDTRARVYVTDRENNRLQVWTY
jgi:tripartite motif-containing protein 71